MRYAPPDYNRYSALWLSGARGQGAATDLNIIRLGRVVDLVNEDLEVAKVNPVTNRPYPRLQIGDLAPTKKYDGAFFFLGSASQVSMANLHPLSQTIRLQQAGQQFDEVTANATILGGFWQDLKRRVVELIAKPAGDIGQDASRGKGPETYAQIEEKLSNINERAHEGDRPSSNAPAIVKGDIPPNTGSALLHHPEIKVFNIPETYRIRGVDLSRYNGAVDFHALREGGVSFVYAKATQGEGKRDPAFAANWKGARAQGLKIGAYHVFDFCASPESQLKTFVEAVPVEANALPPAVDVEFYGTFPPPGGLGSCADVAASRERLRTLLKAIARKYNKVPILYLPPMAIGALIDDTFKDYSLWIASFKKPGAASGGPSMKGANPWTLWQFTDQARVDGLNGPANLNAFFGTASQFDEFAAGTRNVALAAAQ